MYICVSCHMWLYRRPSILSVCLVNSTMSCRRNKTHCTKKTVNCVMRRYSTCQKSVTLTHAICMPTCITYFAHVVLYTCMSHTHVFVKHCICTTYAVLVWPLMCSICLCVTMSGQIHNKCIMNQQHQLFTN